MKISQREIIIGLITLFAALFGVTYMFGESKMTEHRNLVDEKERLEYEIERNKHFIEAQGTWTNRLAELQAQLPVYAASLSSVSGKLLTNIRNIADSTGLDLTQTRANDEKQTGSLFQTSVICNWQGELEELVHFLYQINEQGLRYDVRELSIRPDAKAPNVLRGDLIIDCAYRRVETPKPDTL